MMNELLRLLGQMPYTTMLWLFYGIVVLHELEEWNIDRFERRHFQGLPPAATDRSARMVIAFVSAVGLAWCSAAALSGDPGRAAWIFLPAAAFMLLNAMQHIYWSILFRKAAPGVVTAAGLLVPSTLFLAATAVGWGYVPVWYAAALGVAVVLGFANTAISGTRMPVLIQSGNRIGIWLSERIWQSK